MGLTFAVGLRFARTAQLLPQHGQRLGHGTVLLGEHGAHGLGVETALLAAAVERKGAGCRRAQRRRVDAPGQLPGQLRRFQPAVFFQQRAQGLHALQRGRILLLPALFSPPAVEAQAVVGVVNDPAVALAPVRQGIVHVVHRLGQRRKALGHGFQPGGRRRVAGALHRLGTVGRCGHRSQPAFGQSQHAQDARPCAEQHCKGLPGRLETRYCTKSI